MGISQEHVGERDVDSQEFAWNIRCLNDLSKQKEVRIASLWENSVRIKQVLALSSGFISNHDCQARGRVWVC